VVGYLPVYLTGTRTGYCDGCSIALHADDVHGVAWFAYKVQCANVSNLICVVLLHIVMHRICLFAVS